MGRVHLCMMSMMAFSITVLPVMAQERPNLTNSRIASPFGGNGHNSTLDGRIFIANVGEDHDNIITRWQIRAFRPEALTYDDEGRPDLSAAFSQGQVQEFGGGENALTFCFEDPNSLYVMEGDEAVYRPWVIDSRMYGPGVDFYRFRRRPMTIRVSNPFTPQAEISSWQVGDVEYFSTVGGGAPLGIEPTITADGRLFLFQGGPNNNGAIDHLMYTVNDAPCGASGWSEPRPLSAMYSDPDPRVQKYPLSHKPLYAATGEPFGASRDYLLAAYPWVDPEGRDVFYASVPNPAVGGRREAVSVIGADTRWTAIHIDGGINADRDTVPKLFYSGPMWRLEQERFDADRSATYLPATKIHDVVPLFGSNTADYNEVDLGELVDPFHLLYLPMNELVTRDGEYDLRATPDLSGHFQTGALMGSASIPPTLAVTTSDGLWEPHGRGKALVMQGDGGVRVRLGPEAAAPVDGLTIELSVRPDALGACAAGNRQTLLAKAGITRWSIEADGRVRVNMRLGGRWLDLGWTPPLPRDAWSHLAMTWDGVTGTIELYVNGLPIDADLPTVRGQARLGPGHLFVGTEPGWRSDACDPGAPFRGAIDEVMIFSHARSARSICMHATGVDCLDEAIQVDPSAGQSVLSLTDPDCDGPDALGSLACQTAMHRACAQDGAAAALDSAANAWDMALQLISERPPTAMAGVPSGSQGGVLEVACTPINHDSRAITFRELANYHDGCQWGDPMSSQCTAAAHRFCLDLGWSTGMIFDVTARPWVSCFDADRIETVPRSELGATCEQDVTSGGCRLATSAFCQTRGFAGGVIEELPPGGLADVHCFAASLVGVWPFTP